MPLFLKVAGELLLVAAARSLLRRRREAPPRPGAAVRALGGAARRLTPWAASIRLLRRPAHQAVARRRLALVGDLGLVARVLHAAVPDDPASALPGLRLGVAGLGLTAGFIGILVAGPAALPLAMVLPVAAAFAPDVILARAAYRVRGVVYAALPGVLDLLASCARAGRPLENSLTLAADHAPAPLAALLRRAVSRQAVGQGPSTALRLEAERTGVDRLVSLATLVDRHRELGLPLEAPLLHLADSARMEARTDRLARASRVVPLAGVMTALVVAPACVAGLAAAVLGGVLAAGIG